MQIRHKNVYHKYQSHLTFKSYLQNQDQELIQKIDNYITIFKKQISNISQPHSIHVIILSHEKKVWRSEFDIMLTQNLTLLVQPVSLQL